MSPRPIGAPPPKSGRRRRRGLLWVSLGVLATVVGVGAWLGVRAFMDRGPTLEEQQEAATDIADAVVAELFPEYEGAERVVAHVDSGDGSTVIMVGYSVPADPAAGIPFAKALHVYIDVGDGSFEIEESN